MDFVNKSYNQVADLFGSMTPAARIISGLLLAAIVTSLLFLFRYQTDHADELLFGGETVNQGELVAIEAAFGKAGLSQFEITGNKVKVPRLQRAKYLAALAEANALPQSFGSALQNMFNSDSPFDTRDIRERKANFALESEISKIIRAMANIQDATVKVQEVAVAGFGAPKDRRALVAVKPLGTKKLDSTTLTTIRYTVATGAGVKPEFVTVTDLNGSVSPGIGKEEGVNEFENIYAANQQMFVENYTKLLRERLAPYPGIQIAVHVELDKELLNQTTSFKYDEKPTSLQSTTESKELITKNGDGGGRPGAVANGVAVGNAPAQVASSLQESTSSETREEQKSVVGQTRTTTHRAPLSPFAVTASIGIPTSYFTTIWHMRNPPAAGEAPKTPPADQLKVIEAEKIKEIEEAVISLLPPPPKGDDRYKVVKVQPYDETPVTPIEPPTMASTIGYWFAEHWQTLGLFGLAIFGVTFLRNMIRAASQGAAPIATAEPGAQPASIAAALEKEEQALNEEEAAAEAASNTLKKRFQSTGRGLRDELAELVREDPDAAASVLKLWISNAA